MYNAIQLENFLRRKYGFVKRSNGRFGLELITRCPVCGKKKLSVNARTGLYQCWHGCMAGHVDSLTGDIRIARTEFGAQARRAPPAPGFDMPGTLVPLSQLDEDHQAIQYLIDRGFDPAMLEANYGICYCAEGKKYAGGLFDTSNTIMIPVYQDGKAVAWQARLLYDPAKLDDKTCAALGFIQDPDGDYVKPPKYFTMPGFDKGKMLWNFDWARKGNLVVVCEGVFDAIAVGRCAVAAFGKGVTEDQANALRYYWDLVVLLLDPGDADKEMAKLAGMLKNAVIVTLSGYKDAGEAPQMEIWRQIDAAITNNKVLAQAGRALETYKFIV